MNILFFLGLGVSYGECYAALQAAKHLLAYNHKIEFCLLTNFTELKNQIESEGFTTSTFNISPLHSHKSTEAISLPQNFYDDLSQTLKSFDLIFLIDYHHFFTKAEKIPAAFEVLINTQEVLKNCKKTILTFDHSLWTLNPHPFPIYSEQVEKVPDFISNILLPAPPHTHDYKGMTDKHKRIYFYKKSEKYNKTVSEKLKILLSISHFSPDLAQSNSKISPALLLEHCLSPLNAFLIHENKKAEVEITGLKNIQLPSHYSQITFVDQGMNDLNFSDYDKSLQNLDLVILFNGISSTITRCFLHQVPVLLITSNDFNIYPVYFPPLENIMKQNPYFDHVTRWNLDEELNTDFLFNKALSPQFILDFKSSNLLGEFIQKFS